MDIEIKKKKYLLPRRYWPWAGGAAVVIVLLLWLALGGMASTQSVDGRTLGIGTAERTRFDDFVSVTEIGRAHV